MARKSGELPLIERAASPSPARDALRGSLGGSLTLTKKKSWFGSLRDAVHKGALQAKAAVDSLRGDQTRPETPYRRKISHDDEPRNSQESEVSTTPHKRHPELGLSHNNAIASLRLHLRTGKHKRPSIHTIVNSPHEYLSDTEMSKHAFDHTTDGSPKHGRNMSVASSFIGSLRGLGRKNTLSSQPRSSFDRQYSDNTSTKAQFPSSPIDIPTAAPALSLDLGPTVLMSSGFDSSPKKTQDTDIGVLQDPANITSARPSVEDLRSAGILALNASKFPLKARKAPYATGNMLSLPVFDYELEKSPRPSTPMPGTTFQLDLDGHCSEQSEVFERGVESPDLQLPGGSRHLRHMRSLDAMAQACSIAHQNDDEAKDAHIRHMRSIDALSEACKVAHQNDDTANAAQRQLDEEQSVFKKANQVPEPLTYISQDRVVSDTSTANIIPSDMEELSRQSSHKSNEPSHAADIIHQPLRSATEHGSGPPSPDRSIALPIRTKPNAAFSAQPSCETSDVEMAKLTRQFEEKRSQSPRRLSHRSQTSASPIVFRPFLDRAARDLKVLKPESVPSMRQRYSMDALKSTLSATAPGPNSVLADTETIGLREALQINPDPTQRLRPDAYATSPKDNESVLTDYEEFKTQQLFNDNFEFHTTSPVEGSSIRSRFIPQLYSRLSSPQSSTPSYRSGLTDVRDAFWRMSVNSWLGQNSDSPVVSETEPIRHIAELSIDSSSAETERSPISPLSIDGQISPMGNRLEFEQRRSLRNARYNALQIDEPSSASSASAPIQFDFDLPDSDEDVEPLDLRGYIAPTSSLESLSHRRRIDTSDSQDTSLRDALMANNALQEQLLETIPHIRQKDMSESRESIVSSLKDALLASHTLQVQLGAPESNAAAGFADESSPAPISPSSSRAFSPVTPRREPWTNRFAALTTDTQASGDSSLHRRMSSERTDPAPSQTTPRHHVSKAIIVQDSLDDALELFPSPSSGYKADQSSAGPGSTGKGKTTPARYRRSKDGERKALGEVHGNLV